MAVKRVNELDFYSVGLRDLAKKLNVNETHLLWFIKKEKMQDDLDFFKVIKIGRSPFKRYSGKAYEVLREKFATERLSDMWNRRKAGTEKLRIAS